MYEQWLCCEWLCLDVVHCIVKGNFVMLALSNVRIERA